MGPFPGLRLRISSPPNLPGGWCLPSAPAHLGPWQAGRRGLHEPHPWRLQLCLPLLRPTAASSLRLSCSLVGTGFHSRSSLPPFRLQPRTHLRLSVSLFASSLPVPALSQLLLRDSVTRPSSHGWSLLSSPVCPPGAQTPGFGWSWVCSRWVSAPLGTCSSRRRTTEAVSPEVSVSQAPG